MPSKVDAVVKTFPHQLQTIIGKYERDLANKDMSDDLMHDIARLIEDYQRVLDWTATDLDHKYGKALDRSPYFPLRTDDEAHLRATVKRAFPGLPTAVADAIERHQPYNPGKAELGYLHDLTRVNKHQDFTAQTRQETREIRVTDTRGGTVAYNEHVRFVQGGIALGPGGSISFGPGGAISFGPGGVAAQGVPIDPLTQRPIPSALHQVTETILVGWNFTRPPVPVITTLESLARLIVEALTEIRHEAGL